MKLSELLLGVEVKKVIGSFSSEVKGLSYDSRQVKKDFVFVAISGFRTDGHHYLLEAVKRGATALVVEKEIKNFPQSVAVFQVKSSRRALALMSTNFYGLPSQRIKVIGVTGTNGKTTTVYLLESILKKAGFGVGHITTIDYSWGIGPQPSLATTPEAPELQSLLKKMIEAGYSYAVMEVSSHSLILNRVEGVDFDWAVFTNLTPEHLDFHGSMQAYRKAKLSLFEKMGEEKRVAVNIDDHFGRIIRDKIFCQVVSYGLREGCEIRGQILKFTEQGVLFRLQAKDGSREISLPLLGRHNVYNALAASSVAWGEQIPVSLISQGLESVSQIPGRLELVSGEKQTKIFVDYAHTSDGLEKVLKTLRSITKGKLLVVFGCGGDRDSSKRPRMGRIAHLLANYSVITSDNPRSEDPEKIMLEIEEGIKQVGGRRDKDYLFIPDRREAIAKGMEIMRQNDVLLVAGKGHEKVQIFKDRIEEFNDREVVKELLNKFN